MRLAVRSFRTAKEAFEALRDEEYREFLRDIGCPPEQIEEEVQQLSRDEADRD